MACEYGTPANKQKRCKHQLIHLWVAIINYCLGYIFTSPTGRKFEQDHLLISFSPALKLLLVKPPLHVETFSGNLCATALRNKFQQALHRVGFVKLFRTSVARQVSRKVEPLSTSATARNGLSGEKKKTKSFTV